MLRHLPEGSLFTAKLSAQAEIERKDLEARRDRGEDVEIPEPTELTELERLTQERLVWTTVPSLVATLINRTSYGIESDIEPKHRPEWPVVGPEAWWPEKQKNKSKKSSDKAVTEGGVQESALTRHFAKMGG